MLRKILELIKDYKEKYGKNPEYINITKKGYKRLKKELDILEDKTDDIKMIYLMEFNITEENENVDRSKYDRTRKRN